jgi:soluble lytic murein transglycosylase
MKVSQAAWICLMTMLFGSVSAWSGSARIVLPHAIFDALNTTASLQKEASDSVATNQSNSIAVDNKPINKSSSQPQLPLHPNERQQTSKEISSQLLVDDPTLTDAQQQNQVLNQLEAQRQLYQQAIDALKHGQIKHYQTLKDKLNDYVLYPYLERAYLLDRIKFNNRHEIQDFLDTYGDAPVTIPVRYRFLHLLARKNQTALYLTYYRPMGDITLECHWFKFRLKTDENKENIFKEAERVWLYGKSRPNACDPVFAAMRKSGHLTPELIWSRLLLALNQRNASLVRYLSSLLPSKQKLMGIYAQNALAHPSLLARKPSAQLDAQQLTDIAVILLSKSLWRDPEHGLKLYQQAVIHFPFSKSQQKQLTKTIALALATNNHPKADEWLNLIPATEQDELLLRWKLAHELRQKNWPAVKHWLTHTQPPQNAENDWQYWLARAEQELGNHEQAYQLFEELAQKRSYYGFMASAVIGKQPNLQNKQYDFDPTLIQQLSYRPGILRAYELWKLKKHLSARREWNNEKETLDIKQRAHLAAIAHQWGWYDQAIFSLAETGLHDSVDMVFHSLSKISCSKRPKKRVLI